MCAFVNAGCRRSGTFWEGRFKSALIDSPRYLLVCSRYIELSSVRAQMVELSGDYRCCSYDYYRPLVLMLIHKYK